MDHGGSSPGLMRRCSTATMLGQTGSVAADPDFAQRGGRPAGDGDDRLGLGQGAPVGGRRKRGASAHAIGQSRGGRTSKVHMFVDEAGGPRVVQLSPGQPSDIVADHDLIAASRPSLNLLADRPYDPGDPEQDQPREQTSLRRHRLQAQKRSRAGLRPTQGLPRRRNPMRQDRKELSCRTLHRRSHHPLGQKDPGPRPNPAK